MNNSKAGWRAIWILTYFLIGFVYWKTWSSAPTSDGFVWVNAIDHQNWTEIFRPFHLLPLVFIVLIKAALTALLNHSVSSLQIIQWTNLAAILVSVYLINRFFSDFFYSEFLGWISSILFTFTFSIWHFSNGEIHHLALIFLLISLIRLKQFHKTPCIQTAVQIALLHGLAIACHQEHLLFGAPILWMMLSGKLDRVRLVSFCVYLTVLVAFLIGLFSIVAVQIYQLNDFNQWLNWFFQIQQSGKQSDYHYFAMRKAQILYWLKGFFMSINYGAQIAVDCLRYSDLWRLGRVRMLLLVTCCGLGLIVYAFIKAASGIFKEKIREKQVVLFGILIWLIAYQSIFNFRYTPESSEYYIGSIVPIIFLIIYGLSQIRSIRMSSAIITTLLLFTLGVNLFGGILPWKQHGEMLDGFRSFSDLNFEKRDLFISTESNLDLIILGRFDHFSLKMLYLENTKAESFKKVKDLIERALSQNRRVFIYNVIPSKYAIKHKTNKQDVNNPYLIEDLKTFFNSLQEIYDFNPIYEYWESTTSQIYLFGHRNDFVWQVQKR